MILLILRQRVEKKRFAIVVSYDAHGRGARAAYGFLAVNLLQHPFIVISFSES